jgi:phage gp46-like protein
MPQLQLKSYSTSIDPHNLLDVGIGVFFDPTSGDDEEIALARAVNIALNTDRLALPDDTLPNGQDTDRRGHWADTDVAEIWAGWPVGCRLWLMTRDSLTDSHAAKGSSLERARRYIDEALQPFVVAKIASAYKIDLSQGPDSITGTITIYRGPKSAIALQYQALWTDYA